MEMDCFEEWAENWEVTEQSKVVAEIFVKELIDRDSNLILDLGSGKGILRDFFCKDIPKARVVYIDKAFAMIKGLKEVYPDEFAIRGEGENIPLSENKFDAVIIFNSFPHFTDKEKTISECFRVLRKGGRLIIGHSMTPEEINQLHRDVGNQVAEHKLPEKDIFIEMFSNSGFKDIKYFVNGYFYVMGFKEKEELNLPQNENRESTLRAQSHQILTIKYQNVKLHIKIQKLPLISSENQLIYKGHGNFPHLFKKTN